MAAVLTPFFHAATSTWTWLVEDPATRAAAIVDPALDYDPRSGRIETLLADASSRTCMSASSRCSGSSKPTRMRIISAARSTSRRSSAAAVAIGAGIVAVQAHFKQVFGLGDEFTPDGSAFDHRFHDGERFLVGSLPVEVIAVPGHTPDSLAYRLDDAVFIGDTLFAPDVGSARCDFPGGDAATLWRSIQRLLALPDDTRLCLAHDYPPGGREPRASVTVAEMRSRNVQLGGCDEAAYVALRQARDAGLPAPALLYPALQVNIRAGHLPPPDANGRVYLRTPVQGGF